MSKYSVQKYIDKKWKDIAKDTPTVKAYNLGLAVGYFQAYKNDKVFIGEETMRETWSGLKGDDDFTKTLRTLIELDNSENTSTTEKIAEILENGRKPDEELSNEDRELFEGFMEFLNRKELKLESKNPLKNIKTKEIPTKERKYKYQKEK